jgi:hypothetical protein
LELNSHYFIFLLEPLNFANFPCHLLKLCVFLF